MTIETSKKPSGKPEPTAEDSPTDEVGAAGSTQVDPTNGGARTGLDTALRALRYLIMLGVLGFTASYWWPTQQSYVVDARTRGVSLTFDGGGISAWRLGNATVCIRARGGEAPPAGLAVVGTFQCPEPLYWPLDLPDAEILWLEGTRIDLRATAEGGVAIDLVSTAPGQIVLSGGMRIAIPDFSRILIPPQSWAGHPVLPFSSADIGIGNVPGTGEEGIVMSGRYELRQTLPLRTVPITVDDGIFYTGDRIGFDAGRAHILPPIGAESGYQVYGFIAPLVDTTRIVSVVAYSALSRATLRIDRLGVEIRHIEADWTHRAIRDPFLPAIAALIGFLTLVSPLISVWNSKRRADSRQ